MWPSQMAIKVGYATGVYWTRNSFPLDSALLCQREHLINRFLIARKYMESIPRNIQGLVSDCFPCANTTSLLLVLQYSIPYFL